MGSLRVQGRQLPELPLAVDAQALWKQWADTFDFEFVQAGNMYVAEHESELPVISEYERQAQQMGLSSVKVLDPDEASTLVPFVSGSVAGALYSPMDAHCNPALAVKAVRSMAKGRGVDFHFNKCVIELNENQGTINGVTTESGETIRADAVVLAGGVWTPKIISRLGIFMPIKEVLSTQAETTSVRSAFAPTLRGFSFSARQRPNGRLILGGGLDARVDRVVSVDDLTLMRLWIPRYLKNHRSVRLRFSPKKVQEDLGRHLNGKRVGDLRYPNPRRNAMELSLQHLQARVAGLEAAQISRVWCGFIDNTPDGLPVIERCQRPDGLIVLGGFSGHGLGIAPAVGKIAADLVTAGKTAYDLTSFRSSRFKEPGLPMPERFV